MAEKAEDHFRPDEGAVQDDADGEGAAVIDGMRMGVVHR